MTEKKEKNGNREELLNASMGKLFVQMAVPGMIGMLVIGLYNLVDSIFVGQFVGPAAVSAVAMGYAVVLINQAILSLFATGAMSIFSRAMGAGDEKTMNRLFGNVFWPVGILSVSLSLVTYIFAGKILRIFGAEGDIMVLGTEYLKVLSFGFVFGALGPALNFLIRGEGQMKSAMRIVAAGTIVNIILDPFLIKTAGLGMTGAAGATIIGQALVFSGDLLHLRSNRSIIKLNTRSFKISWDLMPEMLKIGLSGMIMSVAVAIQLSILLFISSGFGVDSNIVMSASFRVMSFFYIPLFGIAYGLQPVIGANYGAMQWRRVSDAWFYFFRIASIIAAVVWLFFQFFSSFVLSWFITDPQIVAAGTPWFRIFQSSFVLYGFVSVSIMLFMAIGKAVKGALLTLGRQLLFFIPLAIILPRLFGETGVWISYPLGDLLVVILGIFLVAGEMKKLRTLEKDPLNLMC